MPYALYVVPAPAMISSRTKMLISSSVSGRLSSMTSASVASMRASTSNDSRSFFGLTRRSAMSGATYSATAFELPKMSLPDVMPTAQSKNFRWSSPGRPSATAIVCTGTLGATSS